MPWCWMPRPAATSSSPPQRTTGCGVVALGHRSHPHRHGRPLPTPLAGSTVDGPPGHSAAPGSGEQPVGERSLRLAIRQLLRPMGDLERLAGRAGRAMPVPAIWWPSPMAWNGCPSSPLGWTLRSVGAPTGCRSC